MKKDIKKAMPGDEALSGDQTQQMVPGTANFVGSPWAQPCGGANERPICSGGTPPFGVAAWPGAVPCPWA